MNFTSRTQHTAAILLTVFAIAKPASAAPSAAPRSASAASTPSKSNNYRPLDTTHSVTTTLGTIPVQSSSEPLTYWFPIPGTERWLPMAWSPVGTGIFSADFGYGNDIANSRSFSWESAAGPLLNTVTSVEFAGTSGAVFLHLTGYYETGAANVVTASVPITTPTNAKYPAGALVLALQTQDSAGDWHDVATSASPAMNGEVTSTITASMGIPGLTFARLELRSASAVTTNGFSVGLASLTVPECIPNPSNPGECTPSSAPPQAPECTYYNDIYFSGGSESVYCPTIPQGASIEIFELGDTGWTSIATYPAGVKPGFSYTLANGAPSGTIMTFAACVETPTNEETPGPSTWGCDQPTVLTVPTMTL